MDLILGNKPLLVGLHLAFSITAIDLFIWLFGELVANSKAYKRIKAVGIGAVISLFLSWFFGGYYYVHYYGTLVKPVILKGAAPWAHAVFMEAKEHAFLFLVPIGLTLMFLTFLDKSEFSASFSKYYKLLALTAAGLGLVIGAMGFIISSAARWG